MGWGNSTNNGYTWDSDSQTLYFDSEHFVRFIEQSLGVIRDRIFWKEHYRMEEEYRENDSYLKPIYEKQKMYREMYSDQVKIIYGNEYPRQELRDTNQTLVDIETEFKKYKKLYDECVEKFHKENPVKYDNNDVWDEFVYEFKHDCYGMGEQVGDMYNGIMNSFKKDYLK